MFARQRLSSFRALLILSCTMPVFAAEPTTTDIGTLDKDSATKAFPGKRAYSPYAGRDFPTRPYFGDTHLHTSFSMDARPEGARVDRKSVV